MNLAIIGCGVIGRRHLESIVNSSINDLNIFVIDTSNECLNECKKIAQNKNTFNIYYLSSAKETNKNFDFVIIANNSKDRFNAIVDLYNYKKPKFIILEKFLFDNLEDYEKAKIIFESINTKVWVNQWVSTGFSELSNFFNESKIFKIVIHGKNWNLCSNSVHFIDWFHSLNKRNEIQLSEINLKNLVLESKRNEFYETYGKLVFKCKENQLTLNCDYDKKGDNKLLISIFCELKVIECEFSGNQLKGTIRHKNNTEDFLMHVNYLSERTSGLIESIFKKNKCSLPTYDQSVVHHKLIFQTLKNHFDRNGLTNSNLSVT